MNPDEVMYVCICKAVTERNVKHAIDGGAISLRQLQDETGAGICCGSCVPELEAALMASRGHERGFISQHRERPVHPVA